MAIIEAGGRRRLKAMDWGFPRQTREVRAHGDPPSRVGLVADLTNPMWSSLVVDTRYRCLIPLSHFANPDGHQGSKTRTWFSIQDCPSVAWACFCRNVPEYGPVYAGMTMTANAAVMPTNDRMPVVTRCEGAGMLAARADRRRSSLPISRTNGGRSDSGRAHG
ncbi:DUF159 family protein [Sphingomonas naphthae]|uniref:DUF159 family protein n=1 Tax=Sphingomonas naphthae TaxID=1813468 RepID=A0ABY7TL72_9SPHN|nr:SOS response-associated peptidase family protein [Sphingomonas naphthae]WCT72609.1 DUF159 family protein [Sphingomonas naphthae]